MMSSPLSLAQLSPSPLSLTKMSSPMSSPLSLAQLSPSPLSLTKISRMMERTELASLNDRLAGYIDRVRMLEDSCSWRRVGEGASGVAQEISLKDHYEEQLNIARKALGDMVKEKATLEMEAQKATLEKEEMEIKNSNLERKLEEMVHKIGECEKERDRLKRRDLLAREIENKKDDEIKVMKQNLAITKGLLEDEKEKADAAKLEKINLENQIRRILEEKTFEKKVRHINMVDDVEKRNGKGYSDSSKMTNERRSKRISVDLSGSEKSRHIKCRKEKVNN